MLNIEGGPARTEVGAGRTLSRASDCTMQLQDGPGPVRAEAKSVIRGQGGSELVRSTAAAGGELCVSGRSERAERSKQPFGAGAALADHAHHAALRAAH